MAVLEGARSHATNSANAARIMEQLPNDLVGGRLLAWQRLNDRRQAIVLAHVDAGCADYVQDDKAGIGVSKEPRTALGGDPGRTSAGQKR